MHIIKSPSVIALLTSIFSILCFYGHFASAQPMIMPKNETVPLLPYLDYYIDETFSMDIEEAAAPGRQDAYQQLEISRLPEVEGITWLRFSVAPVPAGTSSPLYLLDLGQSIPGVPLLFDPVRNELSGAVEWSENMPAQRNIMLMPEARNDPLVCYIRINGIPGPWFWPLLRTPEDAASNWGSLSRTGAILALGVVMLLCLLRGLSENGQWRIWTALYVAVALAQAISGMPEAEGGFGIGRLTAILSPGIALMLLPHVGRHLMATPHNSRSLDIQLILLSLPGAALALLPMLAGWHWLWRWVDLWPACTIIFVPTALGAWIMGLPGSRRFLAGCLVPPIFAAISYFGLDFGLPANLLSSGPLWGVALSALLLTSTRAPVQHHEASTTKNVVVTGSQQEEVINLDHPLDDPNLRLIPAGSVEIDDQAPLSETVHAPRVEEKLLDPPILSPLEEEGEYAIREELDEILRQGAAMGQCALSPAARQYAEKMIAAGERLSEIITGASPRVHPETEAEQSQTPEVFNLQHMLREAHDAVAPMAEQAGIALSWYMPPHLCQLYRGNPHQLGEVLKLLLESAVRSTSHGVAHLSARRVPESKDPGSILFTVTDNGTGYPPKDRSTIALAKAWELAANYDGFIGVEAGPQGATISFSAHFTPLENEDEATPEAAGPHVILACEDMDIRNQLARILENMSIKVSKAVGVKEIALCQKNAPAGLLVAQGKFAMPSAADIIHSFTDLAHKAGFTECHVLAVTRDKSQWHLLKASGFTHAMLEPVEPEDFENTVSGLVERLNSVPIQHPGEPEADSLLSAPIDLTERATGKPANAENGNPESHIANASPENISESPSAAEDGDPLATGFEGPTWLEATHPKGESPKVPDISQPAPKESENEAIKIIQTPAVSEKSADSDEWVGEPVPIPGNRTHAVSQPEPTAPPDQEEWVGEPKPILSETSSGQQENAGTKKNEAKAESLVDFIVGVERDEAPQNTDHKNIGKNQSGSSGGLSFVRSLFSGKTSTGTPTQPPVQKQPETRAAEDEENFIADPELAAMVKNIDRSMKAVLAAYSDKNCQEVAANAGAIAREADKYALRVLSRLAQCVERAANVNDIEAVADLLPDLANGVERNRIYLTQKNKKDSPVAS